MRQKFVNIRTRGLFVATLTLLLSMTAVPLAEAAECATNPDQQTCSATYGVSESFFGSGGVDTCPTIGGNEYCARQTAGELTVGNTKGNQFQAQAGFNTDRDPYVEMSVTKFAVNLGDVSTTSTGFDTAEFTVKCYLSSGYVVQVHGPGPTNVGHEITPMAGAASSQGTEQFGMNLVANATPALGANPSQDPDGTFSFGAAATGYDTADSFRYVDGDTVASSTQSSGFTDYTISYIMNISDVTPGGTYMTNQSLVVTGTF